jgi:hypothetical protein
MSLGCFSASGVEVGLVGTFLDMPLGRFGMESCGSKRRRCLSCGRLMGVWVDS